MSMGSKGGNLRSAKDFMNKASGQTTDGIYNMGFLHSWAHLGKA